MLSRPRILSVLGTRPDAIKTLPVYLALKDRADVEAILVSTGQHREMLDPVLETFGATPDHDLGLMKPGQGLAELTHRALQGLDDAFQRFEPSVVLAQGDTTTTFCAGLCAFYHRLKFGHIEAGLRTGDIHSPFPEEYNRRALALTADHHYAPTHDAAQALRDEGACDSQIFVTGNTSIDAIQRIAGERKESGEGMHILLTAHRRENWGEPMRRIAMAARTLLEQHPGLTITLPMHLNPMVRQTLTEVLGDHDRARLVEPPAYQEFVALMRSADLILSDSGGVQEEAPALGIPVLVLRESTERPEGIEAGCAKLVGTDPDLIVREASLLLESEEARQAMSNATNPYGDGRAAERVAALAAQLAGVDARIPPMMG